MTGDMPAVEVLERERQHYFRELQDLKLDEPAELFQEDELESVGSWVGESDSDSEEDDWDSSGDDTLIHESAAEAVSPRLAAMRAGFPLHDHTFANNPERENAGVRAVTESANVLLDRELRMQQQLEAPVRAQQTSHSQLIPSPTLQPHQPDPPLRCQSPVRRFQSLPRPWTDPNDVDENGFMILRTQAQITWANAFVVYRMKMLEREFVSFLRRFVLMDGV
jgi:hypothetical protein